jgi:tetratricopeptide (TPR) repeat protein/ferredoxin
MYTLEGGLVNAGFIFFAAALVSTLVFGRYFCGWGCHIVALQDLCGWLMKKCGVHPKPFRSRLLVFVPLIVALYMFVWPTFKRTVLFRVLAGGDLERWRADWAGFLGEHRGFPGWSNHLVVEDFWKTFAAWYVAIPFLLVCGFATVYFLGAKGFCTYGCPYGGFFGPLDKVSVGKIKVTDACEGCGHCTATCTSNVRVHEEVRDYGMVVSPGCMKCMDCVSVCPNHALHFGFGKPSAFAAPRSPEAAQRRRAMKGNYDLSWPQEIILAGVFLVLTLGFRGMLNEVPLLMALGLAGVGTFFAWKLLQIVFEKNARIHGFQFKIKGRLRPAALAFIPLATLFLAAGAWGTGVNYCKWYADVVFGRLTIPTAQLLTPGFVPDGDSRRNAALALSCFKLSGPPGEGGWGWKHRPDDLLNMAYLELVAGRIDNAERWLLEVMRRGHPQDALVPELSRIMQMRGATDAELAGVYEQILRWQPHLAGVRANLANFYVNSGRQAEAIRLFEEALVRLPGDAGACATFGALLVEMGQTDRGLELLAEAGAIARGKEGMMVRRSPEAAARVGATYLGIGRPDLALPLFDFCLSLPERERPRGIQLAYAQALFGVGKQAQAIELVTQVAGAEPNNPEPGAILAQMYGALGRQDEAQKWADRAAEAQRRIQEGGSGR